MKFDLGELKRALDWIEANTNELKVSVTIDRHHLYLECFDRKDCAVKITLYSDQAQMLPKIQKTDNL